jgi:soluble lytic murein transglycosylase-like protein
LYRIIYDIRHGRKEGVILMRRLIAQISFVILAVCIGFSVFDLIKDYDQQVETLENNVLKLQNEKKTFKQTIEYLSIVANKQMNSENTIEGYTEWQEANALAQQFHNKSDGKFDKEWALFLVNEAKRYGIDPFIVFELIRVETGDTFNPELTGPPTKYGRAYGLSQFMKNTAPWIADMADLPYDDDMLFDPYYSIQLSIVYLDFLRNRYENWDEALTAYHRGIYGLEKYIAKNGHAKSWYAESIQTNAEELKIIAFND